MPARCRWPRIKRPVKGNTAEEAGHSQKVMARGSEIRLRLSGRLGYASFIIKTPAKTDVKMGMHVSSGTLNRDSGAGGEMAVSPRLGPPLVSRPLRKLVIAVGYRLVFGTT